MGLDRFKGQYIQETAEEKASNRKRRDSLRNIRIGCATGRGCLKTYNHSGAYGDR